MSVAGKTYWLIGASEGLGAALAKKLAEEGAHLVLSARSQDKLEALASTIPNATALPLDVLDMAKLTPPKFDGVIYLAGAYTPMPAQEWDGVAVRQMADVNFIGAINMLDKALPLMLKSNTGHIVLIGSLAGHRGLPRAIGYGASKAGLMHMGETLYADLHKTGIKVQNINPGFIATRLTAKNSFNMPQILSPEKAAEYVFKAMQTNRFETNFPAPFAWLFTLGKFLPRKLFLKFFGA